MEGRRTSLHFRYQHGEAAKGCMAISNPYQERRRQGPVQMTNPDSKDALDFVPSDAYRYRGPKVTYPYCQVEDGMVKHAWAKRDAVVVDGGGTSKSSICTSTQNPSLQVGQHVDAATRLGTLVVSPDRGGKTPPRKQRIPVDNVHVTLLHRLAPTTAKYITFVGQTLCGHEVVRCPG
jgi:hypothetical protein